MKLNMSNRDRIIRTAVGVALLFLGIFLVHGAWRAILLLISAIPFLTAS